MLFIGDLIWKLVLNSFQDLAVTIAFFSTL